MMIMSPDGLLKSFEFIEFDKIFIFYENNKTTNQTCLSYI